MKKYIKPDVEIIKFDIVDVITYSSEWDPFAVNAVDEGVYLEADGYMTPVAE